MDAFLFDGDALRGSGAGGGAMPPNDGFILRFADSSADPDRLRIILMGSAESVRRMIHRFHLEGIAEVGQWSRLMPVPESNEVMSILVLRVRRQE